MPRVVVWNMNHHASSRREEAWAYLRDELRADLALVQEAVPPAGTSAVFRPGGIDGRDGKARQWGSAVVSLNADYPLDVVDGVEGVWRGKGLGRAPLDAVRRGHMAVATVPVDGETLTLVSLYGLIEFGYASGTILRALADLEPLLDDPILGRNVILGGDWNITTQWSGNDARYAAREGGVLRLLESYGLANLLARRVKDRGRLDGCRCELADDCHHVWTYRKADGIPHQDDYVFATENLIDRVKADVADGWVWDRELSDHAPLVCQLE